MGNLIATMGTDESSPAAPAAESSGRAGGGRHSPPKGAPSAPSRWPEAKEPRRRAHTRLLREHIRKQQSAVTYALKDVEAVLHDAALVLHAEPQTVAVPPAGGGRTKASCSRPPVFINVFGDIYAHYKCMWKLFAMASNFPPSDCHHYVFLGNYATHTVMSDAVLQTLVTLLLLKVLYPAHCTLLRGEFEDEAKLTEFKLPQYMAERGVYSATAWAALVRCVHNMPMAAVIDGQFIAVHSGVGPALAACSNPIKEISAIPKGKSLQQLYEHSAAAKELILFYPRMPNEQCDEQFTAEHVHKVLANAKLHAMLRAGSILANGACYPSASAQRADEPQELLSIFSAANLGGDFTNAAAIAIIGDHWPLAIRKAARTRGDIGNVLIATLDMERVTNTTDALSVTDTATVTTVGDKEPAQTQTQPTQVHVKQSKGTAEGKADNGGVPPSPRSDSKGNAAGTGSTPSTPQAHGGESRDTRTQTQKRLAKGTSASPSTAKCNDNGVGTSTLSAGRSRSGKAMSTKTAKDGAAPVARL